MLAVDLIVIQNRNAQLQIIRITLGNDRVAHHYAYNRFRIGDRLNLHRRLLLYVNHCINGRATDVMITKLYEGAA